MANDIAAGRGIILQQQKNAKVEKYLEFQDKLGPNSNHLMLPGGNLLKCEPCWTSRKGKCDHQNPGPCGFCVIKGRPEECVYVLPTGETIRVS